MTDEPRLSNQRLQEMADACAAMVSHLGTFTGPECAMIFTSALSAWLVSHADDKEQAVRAIKYITEATTKAVIEAPWEVETEH